MSHGQNHHANVIGSGGFWKVKLLDVYKWNTLDFNCISWKSSLLFCSISLSVTGHQVLGQCRWSRALVVGQMQSPFEEMSKKKCVCKHVGYLIGKCSHLNEEFWLTLPVCFSHIHLQLSYFKKLPPKIISTAFLCTLSIMTVLGKCNVSEIRGEPLDHQQLSYWLKGKHVFMWFLTAARCRLVQGEREREREKEKNPKRSPVRLQKSGSTRVGLCHSHLSVSSQWKQLATRACL